MGIFPKGYEQISVHLRYQINHSTKVSLGGPMSYWTYLQEHRWLRQLIIVKTVPAWVITPKLHPMSSVSNLQATTSSNCYCFYIPGGVLWILLVCFRILLNRVGFVLSPESHKYLSSLGWECFHSEERTTWYHANQLCMEWLWMANCTLTCLLISQGR